MPKYSVEVQRTISVTVEVESDTPQEALETVSKDSFPLPPRDEWDGQKDWSFRVSDENGIELLDSER